MTSLRKIDSTVLTTELYGVVGYPVKHSLSPAMQNAAFKALKMNAFYIPIEIRPEVLPAFLKKLPSSGIKGLNLTIPHKELAFKNLRILSKTARISGTVNTVKVKGRTIKGFSTDSFGLLAALKDDFRLTSLKGKTILLLGAGGAAKAVASALAGSGIKALYIANRTLEKATKLAEVAEKNSHIPCRAFPLLDKAVLALIADIDLLVNATSAGLMKGDRSPLSSTALRKDILVYDMIYNPALTPLMKEARKAGAKTSNGLSMLLYQGAASFEIWTGKKAPLAVMRKALAGESRLKC